MQTSRYWFRPLSPERRVEVMEELSQAASPTFDFFLLVVLSALIATFGLVTNSAAVIIGAMLIAPLMSPILGLSLASVAGKENMYRRSVVALLEGALLAVSLASLLAWVSRILPFGMLAGIPSEVLARTHPNPFDLMIALAGGAAAAYALAQPHLSAALPGVAIATALMPPLCTVGIGISLGDWGIASGALLLFLSNFAAISFGGIIIFVSLGFRPLNQGRVFNKVPRSLLVSAILVLILLIPLAVSTVQFVNQARREQVIRETIRAATIQELDSIHLVDIQSIQQADTLQVEITIRSQRQPTYEQVVELQKEIAGRLQQTVELQLLVVPSTRLDPLIPPTLTFTPTAGPSQSPTPTITNTPTQLPTPTITPTVTETPTATPTATPVTAYIASPDGLGAVIRDMPGGKIVCFVSEGAPVLLLYQRQTLRGVEWIEVRDLLGRQGWVLAKQIVIRP